MFNCTFIFTLIVQNHAIEAHPQVEVDSSIVSIGIVEIEPNNEAVFFNRRETDRGFRLVAQSATHIPSTQPTIREGVIGDGICMPLAKLRIGTPFSRIVSEGATIGIEIKESLRIAFDTPDGVFDRPIPYLTASESFPVWKCLLEEPCDGLPDSARNRILLRGRSP